MDFFHLLFFLLIFDVFLKCFLRCVFSFVFFFFFIFPVFLILAFLFIFFFSSFHFCLVFLKDSLHSGKSKVTRVTVGRDTNQPTNQSSRVCKVDLPTLKVAIRLQTYSSSVLLRVIAFLFFFCKCALRCFVGQKLHCFGYVRPHLGAVYFSKREKEKEASKGYLPRRLNNFLKKCYKKSCSNRGQKN